jgi:sugar-specific transcriptional regulator TrmB
MHLEILTEIGLSQNEAKIYENLLNLGESNIAQIALKSKIHRRNVYDNIDRLIEKGLIYQVIGKGDSTYKPVDPNKLSEIINEKQRKHIDLHVR